MSRRQKQYDEYDDYYDDVESGGSRALAGGTAELVTRKALDWGISGSIVAILLLTLLYAISPLDFVPDLIPVAGQADDLAAILAGGGSITFLTVLRYVLRTRVGRWGCFFVIVLAAIGALAVFLVLIQLFNALL